MSDPSTEVDDQPEAPANDEVRERIVDDLRTDIGDGLIDSHILAGVDLWVRVTPEAWADAAASLKTRGFEFFDFLSAIDWMPSPWGNSENDPFADDSADNAEPGDDDADEMRRGYTGGDTRFQVFARFTNLDDHIGITIKADVPESLEVPTLIASFAGANWHEREAHEMYGIGFVGHPDLRNLYLPTEFEGYPLRKDFPLLARHIKPWPGIVDVEPMPASDDAEEAGDA